MLQTNITQILFLFSKKKNKIKVINGVRGLNLEIYARDIRIF